MLAVIVHEFVQRNKTAGNAYVNIKLFVMCWIIEMN